MPGSQRHLSMMEIESGAGESPGRIVSDGKVIRIVSFVTKLSIRLNKKDAFFANYFILFPVVMLKYRE